MEDVTTLNQALIECVKAAGGSKKVGPTLWPEKPVTDAQKLLLACLNDDRAEKLSPDQAMLIMRLAKKQGSHFGIQFLCEELGYTIPTPITKEDAKAELMREFIEAQKTISLIAFRIEELSK